MKQYEPDQIVKSCSRIESGLRLAHDGVRACTFSTGAVEAPNYWEPDQIPDNLTKEMIVDKRRQLFERLNDPNDNDFLCRKCTHWVEKKYKDVRFDQLEFLNVAHFSACNLRCNYCSFTKNNDFKKEKYSALSILKHFDARDVTFEASVDFNAGEPTLMKDLAEHLDFFRKNNMRVRLYSNGVIYSQAVYDAVKDGTITWLIISVDAGTPSTYLKTKKSNFFSDVIKNIAKYREAEATGIGKVAAKYIFTEDTLGDDDLFGFLYAMLAIGIVNVWLLHDYSLSYFDNLEDKDHFIEAYAKLYNLFVSWGITPLHFGDSAAGDVIPVMKNFQEKTKIRIEEMKNKKISSKSIDESKITIFKNKQINFKNYKRYQLKDLEALSKEIGNSKVLVSPSGVATLNLLNNSYFSQLNITSFADLSISKHGKKLNGISVKSYKDLKDIEFDKIIITSEYFMNSILNDISDGVGIEGKEIYLISDEPLNRRY